MIFREHFLEKEIFKLEDTTVVNHHVVMPHQANPNGYLFGGVTLSWIDLTAAIVAEKYTQKTVATVHIDELTFFRTVKVGDHVSIKATINYVGNTSLVIRVVVDAQNPKSGESWHITTAFLTFVAVDEKGIPSKIPQLSLKLPDDIKIFNDLKRKLELRKNKIT